MAKSLSFPPSSAYGLSDRRAVLVGRAAELRELEGALQAVRESGTARCITVLGANGIGKTRLVRDFLLKARANSDAGPRVIRGSARNQGAAYGVFARVLRARFGIVEGMDPEASKAQVRAQVSVVLDDRKVGDVLYFLGQLLELEFQDSPLVKAVAADNKQLVFLRRAIIKRFFEADAGTEALGVGEASRPLVLVFDDLHWAHEESLDLLAYLIDTLKAPILVIALARAEMLVRRDDWAQYGGKRHKLIDLAPLSDTDAAAVMHDLLSPCGEDASVEALVEAGCNLAGGNPALLEQMVHIYIDMGVLEVEEGLTGDEKWTIHTDKLAAVRLPLTIEEAVDARIASLAPNERTLLERASVMGSVFWLGGLLALERLDETPPELWTGNESQSLVRVRELLDGLRERDYILKLHDSTFSGDEEFVFKHNLEREALAKLVPPAAARKYHGVLADWLAFKSHVRTHEEYLAMLAHHREKSGAKTHAAIAWCEAGDVARVRYANAKAAEYYAKVLALLNDGAEADADQRMRALHYYGDVLQALGRNDEALSTFREMLAHAFRLDQKARGGAAHSRIGRLYRDTGSLYEASYHLKAALQLFEVSGDDRGVSSTLDDIGKLYWLRGDYPQALEFAQRALSMRRKLGDRRSIALSLNNLGLVYQDTGRFRDALESFEQALRIRREIGDLVGVATSLNNLGTVAYDQRDDARALALFQEAYEVAKETGDRNRIALVLTNLGETYSRLGDVPQAIRYLKNAEELADDLGDKLGLAEAVRGLGKAYLAQKEYTKARECTARAVEIFTEVQSKVQLGIALRALGEVMAAASAGGDGLASAREHLLRSVKIFEEIGNEVELARSCRIYAEVLRGSPAFQTDAELASEASTFAKRAEEIATKLGGLPLTTESHALSTTR